MSYNKCCFNHEFQWYTISLFCNQPSVWDYYEKNLLLDVTNQENVTQNEFFYEKGTPPKTEGYPKWNFKSWNSIAFQSDIDHLLQMLDEKFCVKNGYSCCRVLGCHHQSFSSSMCHEEFEMTWVDFSFLVIKTIWFPLNFFSQSFGLWSLQLFNW